MKFIDYDGIEFPFADNTFDCVVSRYALHHFPDIEKAFSEIKQGVERLMDNYLFLIPHQMKKIKTGL